MNRAFWSGRPVLVTGHTGFKGTWLTHWLTVLGAQVTGYSLPDDVRDPGALGDAVKAAQPEVVLHLAAQAQVRASYDDPAATFGTNVIGTVHLLDAIRDTPSVRVGVVVSSDKCYANDGRAHAFREDDRLGGRDPYSASKACAELAVAAYRESFFAAPDAPRIVSVRAGNVIGGGDWSTDRLVPDLVRAFRAGTPAAVRNPDATRPWQFVLDALHGYLATAELAYDGRDVPHALNFGPPATETRSVSWLAESMAARWGDGATWKPTPAAGPAEAATLALDSSLAHDVLGWRPVLPTETAVAWTVDWYRSEPSPTATQIDEFMRLIP